MRGDRKLITAVDESAARGGITLDPAQRLLLGRLADLGSNLDRRSLRSPASSLYVYGPSGRGRSWLADAIYAALPTTRKTRVHFHGFFDKLHRSIHDHRTERDAVERAIDDVTANSQLLFFDELHVHDSGDARLLTRLLDHVFRRDLTAGNGSSLPPQVASEMVSGHP
ncbi:AFG1/ZapE family ATPase [Glaciibacter superstes]|uniref:AFG1/ZapE family ATPase n=1 Tax=Glaciibacter superstes TaxID=501023 RepID=UPI0003B329FC|nr:AFG1/ZapE family ATPase [Glaciibacter superstes]